MAKTNYEDSTKDDLVEEIKQRRAAGRQVKVDLRGDKQSLIDALIVDDASADTPAHLDNQLDAPNGQDEANPSQPSSEAFAKGQLVLHKETKKKFQMVRVTDDPYNKPIKCRIPAQSNGHPGLYWEGTEAEFSTEFEKA